MSSPEQENLAERSQASKLVGDEILRQIIREELASYNLSPKRENKAWSLLNSGFGLWLLSSVMLGLLTFSYSKWEAHRGEAAKTISQVRKLDTEIAYRFSLRPLL